MVKHKKRWYERKDVRALAIAALVGALSVFLIAGIAVVVVVRYIKSLCNRDPRFDQELGKIKEYMEDHFQLLRKSSIRVRAPTPPGTSPSLFEASDRRPMNYDPSHQELQMRLNDLRNHEEPEK